MSSLSRRQFMSGALAGTGKVHRTQIKSCEVVIGRVVDFPVGRVTVSAARKMIIESLPQGIRVRSAADGSLFYSVKTNRFGELVVNPAEIWPAGQVFSILTNEPAWLDTSQGDQS